MAFDNHIDTEMEDCNMLVSDCVVLCCCSQCLILQIIIFVFLNLHVKLIRKTKRYAKKKLNERRRKEGKIMIERVKGGLFQDEVKVEAVTKGCMSITNELIQASGGGGGEGQFGVQFCIEEVEKVLEELSRKGEFAFGSFWGRSDDSDASSPSTSSPSSLSCLLDNERFDFVHYYELVDMSCFISAACSLHHFMTFRKHWTWYCC